MSREIDQRVVEMEFDNQEFERRISKTTNSLGKLKEALNLDDAAEGFDQIQDSVNRIDFSGLANISAMALAKFKLVSQAIDTVINKTKQFVESVTIQPVTQGWEKYADITQATQTIMAATAKDFADEAEQISVVNTELEKLNWFTDETSYNLTDMTNNIGKFTSNGVKLETAVTAMQGIGTWASMSGQGVNEASRVMYNMSQALGTGAVLVRDWMSVENANMATVEFKQNVIDSAVEMGTLVKVGEDLYKTLEGNEVTVKTFREELKDKWFTSDVLMKALDKYGGFTNKLNEYYNKYNESSGLLTSEILDFTNDFIKGNLDIEKTAKRTGLSVEELTEMVTELSKSEYDLGRKSFQAAQEAKTFQEAIAATQDAVSTGWMKTFQLVFGDYKEAKKLWTALANELYDVFAEPGNFRNAVLENWVDMVDEVSGLNGRQLWWGDFDENAGIVGNIWENVKNISGAITDAFSMVFHTFQSAEDIAGVLFNISKWLHDTTADLILTDDQINAIWDAAIGLFTVVRTIGRFAAAVIKPTVKFIAEIAGYFVKTLFPEVGKLSTVVGDLFRQLGQKSVLNAISSGLEKLYSVMSKVVKELIDVIARIIRVPTNAIEKGLQAYNAWMRATGDFGKSIVVGITKGFRALLTGVGNLLSEVTGIEYFSELFNGIADTIRRSTNYIMKLSSWVKTTFNAFGGGIDGALHASLGFYDALGDIFGWFSKITGIEWFKTFGEKVTTTLYDVQNKVVGFVKNIRSQIEFYGGGLSGALHWMINNAASFFSNKLYSLYLTTGNEWFLKVRDKASTFFVNLYKNVDTFVERLREAMRKISDFFAPYVNLAKSAFGAIFGPDEEPTDPLDDLADSTEKNANRMQVAYKSISQMALEYIRGDWGNGLERDERSVAAGYDNERIQKVVNDIWTLTGEFKDGYQEILAQYDNVDARLDGNILPVDADSPKNKKLLKVVKDTENSIAHAVLDLEGDVVQPIKEIKKESKSLQDQFEDAKAKTFAILPALFSGIGVAIAKIVVAAKNLKASIVSFIEENHVIDKVVDGIFKVASGIGTVFTSLGKFLTDVGPSVIDFLVKSVKSIIGFGQKIVKYTSQTLQSLGRTFRGTGSMFSELITATLKGDWKTAGSKISEIFTKVRKNFDQEAKLFAYRMYKLHDPIAEFMKAVAIAKNFIVAGVKGIGSGILGLFKKSEDEGENASGGIKKFATSISTFFETAFKGTLPVFEQLQKALLLSDWAKAKEVFATFISQIRENLRDTYPELSAFIDNVEAIIPSVKEAITTIWGFLKTAASNAWNTVVTTWTTLKELFAGTGVSLKNIFTGLLEGNWDSVFKNLSVLWYQLWENFKFVFNKSLDSIAEKYPTFGKILQSLRDFLQKYGPLFKTAAENIKKFFGTIATTAWSGIKTVWSGLSKVFEGTGELFSNLFSSLLGGDKSGTKQATKDLTRTLYRNASRSINDAVDELADDHPKLYVLVKTISAVKDKLVSIFSKLTSFMKANMPSLKAAFLNGISTIKKGIGDLGPKFKALFSSLFKMDFKTAWDTVKDIFNYLYKAIASGVKGLIEKLKIFFAPFVKDPLGVIGRIAKKLGNVPLEIFNFFKDLLSFGSDAASSKLPSAATIERVKNVITAILSLLKDAGAALSMFRAATMLKHVGSAAKGIANLSDTISEVLNTKVLKKKSKIDTFVDTLKMLAIIFAVVVATVIILGNQDPAVLEQGMDAAGKIAVAIIGFMVIIKILEKILGKDTGSSFSKFGKSFLELAAGLLVMYFAIKAFGNIDGDVLAKGLFSVGLVLLELAIFSRLISTKKGATVMDVGKQLLMCAASILVLCLSIKILGSMDFGVLAQGLLAIAAILLAFGIFAQFLRTKGGQIMKIGGTLLALAAAVYVLTYSVDKLGSMELGKLAKGVTAVVISLIAMGVAVRLMKDVKASTAIVIVALASALLIMTSAVESLSQLSIEELAKGVGSIVILMVALGGMASLMSASKPTFKTAIASGLILAELLIAAKFAVEIMNDMTDDENALEKSAALSLLIVAMGGMASLLAVAKPGFTEAIASALLLGEMIVTAAAAAWILSDMDDSVTLEKAEALSMVVGTMGAVATALSLAHPDFDTGLAAAVAMAGMGASAIEAAVAINALEDDDLILEKAEALSMIVGTMGAVATAMSWKNLSWTAGAKAGANLVEFIGVVIGGMALLGGIKYGIDTVLNGVTGGKVTVDDLIENVIPSFEKIGDAFGSMAGHFIGSFKAAELEASQGAMEKFFNEFDTPDEETKTAVTETVTLLTDLENGLPSSGGLMQFWFGEKKWSTISEGLVDFGTALAGFSSAVSGEEGATIDKDKIQNACEAGKALSEVLSGLPETPGSIASWFQGTYEWSTISEGLPEFGVALASFSSSVSNETFNKEAIEAACGAGTVLATLLKDLPETPGSVAEWFQGTYEWSTISEGLPEFGAALVAFAAAVTGEGSNLDSTTVGTACDVGLKLANMLGSLPKSPGFVSKWFVDETKWSTISVGLADFGTALKDFSVNVEGSSTSDVDNAVEVAGKLVEIANKIPVSGSLYNLIFGEHSMSDFSAGVVLLGGALKSYARSAKLIDAEKVSSSVEIAGSLVEVSEKIPQSGGAMQWLFGTHSMEDFAGAIEKLGDALVSYSDRAAKIDTTSVKFATTVAQSISNTIAETQTYKVGLAIDLFDFAEALCDAAEKFEDLNTDNLIAVTTAFTTMSTASEDLKSAMSGLAGSALIAFNNAILSEDNAYIYDKISNNFAILLRNRLISQTSEYRKKILDAFKSLATDSIVAYNSSLLTDDSGLLFDKIARNFRVLINNRINNESNENRIAITKAFKDLAVDSIEEFQDGFSGNNSESEYNTAISYLQTEITGRLNGDNGSFKEDILESFKTLAVKAVQKFRNTLVNKDTVDHYNAGITNFTHNVTARVDSGKYHDEILESYKNLAIASVDEFTNEFSSVESNAKYDSSIGNLKTYVSTLLVDAANSMVASISSTFFDGYNLVYHSARNIMQAVIDGVNSRYSEVYNVGVNTMQGFNNGMNALAPSIYATANTIATNIGASLRTPLRVNSPSELTTEFGEYIDQGLINGMMAKSQDVWDASSYVATGVSDVMDSIIQNATKAIEEDTNPTITPVVDMSNITQSAGYINTMLGGMYGINASINAAQAARVGTMSVNAQQVTRDSNYQDSLDSIRSDIKNLSASIQNMKIVMDSGALVGSIAAPMDVALGKRVMHKARRN